MLPLVPFSLALALTAVRHIVAIHYPDVALRWVTLAGYSLVLLASLLLPAFSPLPLVSAIGETLLFTWDRTSQACAAVLILAVLAYEGVSLSERHACSGTLILAMGLLCLAAGSARSQATTLSLLSLIILSIEGQLTSRMRSAFAVLAIWALLLSLSLIGLYALWPTLSEQPRQALGWLLPIAAVAQVLAAMGLGYPAVRWPSVSTLIVTATAVLLRSPSGASGLSTTAIPLALLGGLVMLGASLAAVLWGPRGRSLDALFVMSLGSALLAHALDGAIGTSTAALALLGTLLAYATLIALDGSAATGCYCIPRALAVAALAGIGPGSMLTVRWRLISMSLARGDAWLVFWQLLTALLSCSVAATLLIPWLKEPGRRIEPNDWASWGIGALLALTVLLLSIAPALVGPGLPWLGAPSSHRYLGLALTLTPAVMVVCLALSSSWLRTRARMERWREPSRRVWQNAWERSLLWIDQAAGWAAALLGRGLHLLEERLIIVWSLLCALILLLIAVDYGL